jgi:cytochrome c556
MSSRNIPRMIRRIAEATEALGLMAKGQAPFDDEAARAALAQISATCRSCHAADRE